MVDNLQMKFIDNKIFGKFVQRLSKDYEIFYPKKIERYWDWARWKEEEEFSLQGYRTLLPARYFFYSLQENLIEKKRKKTVIFGVRSCDLQGLNLLKKIYLENPEDPYFRKDILIFSSDCSNFSEDCFCTVLRNKPQPETDFDLNFSYLKEGYIVEIGSDRGKNLLNDYGEFFQGVEDSYLKQRDLRRLNLEEEIKKHNGEKILNLEEFREKIKKENFEEYVKNCVSCSACTNICPACFCFLLSEGLQNKIRYTDSCQFKGYRRVAGGQNPGKALLTRFKNRFSCKFIYRVEVQKILGCTGCGRCVSSCQGKINFREIILKFGV